MRIQEKIKKDLVGAMKARDDDKKNTLRVIMGEFARMESKELSDDQVVKICKKLIKAEKEVLQKTGAEAGSRFIDIVAGYLPDMATTEDIHQWISENVDFSQFKNKMQAMGMIMKHFGSAADGNEVKKVLQNM